jgi:hypothetical protein
MRSPFDEIPEGVRTGASPLPTGATIEHPERAKVKDGRVGGIDRILLERIRGTHGGKAWGGADKKHIAATGAGKAGHRGRAIALVPHGMKKSGPVSVIVHFHGIDIGPYAGTSGMRETGDRPEDVEHFQLPQQLEAYTKKHPGGRVVVLMPLGATMKAGKGFTVDFGLRDMDTFVDDCLGQLGLGDAGGRVYLSAHSGGGFTISALMNDPGRLPKRYRFGGVFGFESFHGDLGTWSKLVTDRLDADLATLEALNDEKAQLAYLRAQGFRFAAFGGSNTGYTNRVTALRNAILDWFKKRQDRLKKATARKAGVLDQLWRNYQAIYAKQAHMAALAQDSHFESVLESLGGSAPVSAPAPAPVLHQDGPAEPKPPAKKEEDPAPAAEASADRPFRLQRYPSDEGDLAKARKLKVLVPKKGHKREIAKAPAVYLVDVLKEAKIPEADKWFDQFTTDLRFLGRRFRQPIHRHLAEHLREVEKELTVKYGGPDKDPVLAGKVLGLDENIIGARAYPTVAAVSMHMFGLAIDVNYKHNPMIHPGGSENEVFARAGELVDGKKSKLTIGMSHAEASRLNKLIVEYFRLAKDRKALAAKLKGAGGFWKGMEVESAQQRIENDLSEKPVSAKEAKKRGIASTAGGLAYRWARGDDIEMIRTQGFLNLKEELVRGLKMNWGGSYGDMMHFDMRDDGSKGQAIYAAINRYFAKLKREADAPGPQ